MKKLLSAVGIGAIIAVIGIVVANRKKTAH